MSDVTTQNETTSEDTLPDVAEVMQNLADAEAAEAEQEASLAVLTLDEAVERIEDGSRIDPSGGKSWAEIIDAVKVAAVGVATMIVSLGKVRYEAGRALGEAYRLILLPNGIPDWGGKSEAAKVVRQYAIDSAMEKIADATQSQRDNERNAIVKQYERNHRERLIREYVATTATQLDAEGNSLPLFPDGPDDTNGLFLAHVREQFLKSGVGTTRAMPEKYRNAEDKDAMRQSSGGPGNGKKSAREVIGAAVEAVANVAIRWAVLSLLQMATVIVKRLEDGENLQFGGQDDKDAVGEILDRVSELSKYGSRLVAYRDKVTADEAETALLLMFDADADNPDK